MADLARAVAVLRITDHLLIPDEVSALLRCRPTCSWSKGETWTAQGVVRTRTFGSWMLQAEETKPADIDAQVAAILDQATTDLSAWSALRSWYYVSVFCGWFMDRGNESVSIAPETMFALGTRGVSLDIDLYAGDSE